MKPLIVNFQSTNESYDSVFNGLNNILLRIKWEQSAAQLHRILILWNSANHSPSVDIPAGGGYASGNARVAESDVHDIRTETRQIAQGSLCSEQSKWPSIKIELEIAFKVPNEPRFGKANLARRVLIPSPRAALCIEIRSTNLKIIEGTQIIKVIQLATVSK